MRALYQIPRERRPANNGNAGLWYDKYCNTWPREREWKWSLASYKERNREVNPKLNWIKTVTQSPVGVQAELQEAYNRRLSLAKAWDAEPQVFKTDWRFVTGFGREHPVENGFAWHHTLGVPYLPGSSVKGMVRAWAEQWLDSDSEQTKDDIKRIFGPKGEGKVGSVIFFDALPSKPVTLEIDIMTPHYGPWYSDRKPPGDWYDPVPIPFLTVAANQEFIFLITPRKDTEEAAKDAETVRKWLVEALEWIGAGAKTAVGYGRMSASKTKANCQWLEQQIEELAQAHNSPHEQIWRGKTLAEQWQQLEDKEIKRQALECIKAYWKEQGLWENTRGRGAIRAKEIYEAWQQEEQ